MDSDRNQRRKGSVYSMTVRAGKRRTYFFDVKQTKVNDYYLIITESKKREGDYERHKIFLYKEDFNRFLEGLLQTIDYIKSDLMPEYDYDEYNRSNEYEDENEAPPKNHDDTVQLERTTSSSIDEDLAW